MNRPTVETFAEKVTRLQREIAIRQAELRRLVCGDPAKGVTGPKPIDWPEYLELKE